MTSDDYRERARTEWIAHGERSIYSSRWVDVRLVDVEAPDGHRFEHHVLRMQRVAVAAVLVWLVDNIPEDLVLYGPFSNRSGSDALRERIIAQERVELAAAPWYGNGPGMAQVKVRNLEFFFHNSYLAVRQEGGWIALLLVLGLMAFAFLRLSRHSRAGDLAAAGAQAALIGTAVMAITLGEVLLDTPMAIAVGFALGRALHPPPEQALHLPPEGVADA